MDVVVQAALVMEDGNLVVDGDPRAILDYSGADNVDAFKDKAMVRLGIDAARAKYVKLRGPLDALDPANLAPFLAPGLLRTSPVVKMSTIIVPRSSVEGIVYYFVASEGAFVRDALSPRRGRHDARAASCCSTSL